MPDLTLSQLSTALLGPVDLAIPSGRTATISGVSGSGKTLLLRAIADLDPHQGRIHFGDREQAMLSGPEWRRRVGFLPAESAWWADRVGEHFMRVETALLRQLGFHPECLDWEIARLSSGERQRLALARLLSGAPEALLLDEPTANLDAENRALVEAVVAEYQQQHSAPVLWVSHDPTQRQRLSASGFRLEGGQLFPERP